MAGELFCKKKQIDSIHRVDKKNTKDWKSTQEFGVKIHLLGRMVGIGMMNG
jgi:hypothetical protein